jgi:hypothetical protein
LVQQGHENFVKRSAIAREKIAKIVKDAQAAVVNILEGARTAVRDVSLDQLGLHGLHMKECDPVVTLPRDLQFPYQLSYDNQIIGLRYHPEIVGLNFVMSHGEKSDLLDEVDPDNWFEVIRP